METKPDLQMLMARKLEGTITPEELAMLQTMIAASAEVAEEYKVYEKIWITSPDLLIPKGLPVETRWQDLEAKIADHKPATRSRQLAWLRYAAAAAVLTVLTTVYLLN